MAWIIGIILLLIAVSLLIVSKAFRIAVIVTGVVVVGAVFVFIMHDQRQERLAKSRIKSEEVEIRDLSLIKSKSGLAVFKLKGSVKNLNPTYTLTGFTLSLKLYDCPADKEVGLVDCDTIWEQEESVSSSIPPGQVRGLEESVYVHDLPTIKGRFTWSHSISSTRGSH